MDDVLLDVTTHGPVQRWSGESAWHFLHLPAEVSLEVRDLVEPRGFGSVRVRATIGATTWSTSLFPDSASGCYLLPLKAAVRRAEGLEDGDTAEVRLLVHG